MVLLEEKLRFAMVLVVESLGFPMASVAFCGHVGVDSNTPRALAEQLPGRAATLAVWSFLSKGRGNMRNKRGRRAAPRGRQRFWL